MKERRALCYALEEVRRNQSGTYRTEPIQHAYLSGWAACEELMNHRDSELKEACKGALRYLESVKRNEQQIQEAFQAKGWSSAWIFTTLDLNIERLEKAIKEVPHDSV